MGRLMSGPGPTGMSGAAAAFSAYATAEEVSIDRLTANLMRLQSAWQDPAAAAMARSLTQRLIWKRVLLSQLVTEAARKTSQAAAYSSTLAGMAHPPEITQNHTTHATLQATNFLGVNTAAIAAKEAEYAAMWAQNAAMMSTYLAQTLANTTPVKFAPSSPMASVIMPPTSVMTALGGGAEGAVSRLQLVAADAASMGIIGGTTVGIAAGWGATAAQTPDRVQGYAAAAQNDARLADADQKSTRQQQQLASGQQLGQQLIQQLASQGPSQAGQVGQQVLQGPQQLVQQASQVPQQALQPLSQLVSSINQDLRPESVGYFGASPSSPTLDSLAGQGAAPALGAASFTGLGSAGLAGVSTGFRVPSTWSASSPLIAPPPTAPAAPAPSGAGSGVPGSSAPVTSSRGRSKSATPTVVDAAPVPIYQDEAPVRATVSLAAAIAAATGEPVSDGDDPPEGQDG